MPITLNGLSSTPRSDVLNSVQTRVLYTGSAGAGLVNSAASGTVIYGVNFKIRKVAISFTAIDSVAGTDLFNIVVGPGPYTQGNIAQNDNSFDPSASTTVGVSGQSPTVLGGLGYPTNVATIGQSLFPADVPFTAANFPNITTATGGYAIFIPQNYDAVFPGNIPITLRLTTTATTGSISNLSVNLVISPVRLRPAPVGSQTYAAVPGVDY